MGSSYNPENKIPSGTYWKVHLVNMKVQAQFFRITTGKQSEPGTFAEPM